MKTLYPFLLFLTLVLTACTAGRPVTDLRVSMTDFAYQPNRFTVPAGQEITLDIANNGAVVHNFIILRSGQVPGDHFDPNDPAKVYWQVELLPGERVQTTFPAPSEPGEYVIVCSTAGHYEAGMTGMLVVEE
jgi:plastocyanin